MPMHETELAPKVLAELTLALSAASKGHWDDAVFRIDQARMHTQDLTTTRRAYDLIVSWSAPIDREGQLTDHDRFEWVRVCAGTRELAHMQARQWARESYDLEDDVVVHTTIDPNSPL